MPANFASAPQICARCLRANRRIKAFPTYPLIHRSTFTDAVLPSREQKDNDNGGHVSRPENKDGAKNNEHKLEEKEEGAMSRRLRAMGEDALESGGKSTQKAISEAGFSEELRKELEDRIASASFRAEHRNAFTEAGLPSHAGRGTRDIALGDAWTGDESIHDVSLRMLDDAHKPLRLGRPPPIPGPAARPPRSIDTGRAQSGAATGTRLANARDRSGMYSSLKDSDMEASERDKRFQLLKERFSANSRAVMPGTVQGLANLANQRIEDAIARGQFKNLPRGKVIERDYNASSPFIDTTEYFMNKIIQKQEIVPPWIEKQQELVRAAARFRTRLRTDWKRHAARVIASSGGTLQEQMRRAEAYAQAELRANPAKTKDEVLNSVDDAGHVSQTSVSGEPRAPESSNDTTAINTSTPEQSSPQSTPAPYPFRDPAWEATETPYLTAVIKELNSTTRSYNLQAPELARKAYFSLPREIRSCYADVAPQIAEAIRDRASAPKKTESFGASLAASDSVLDRFVGEKVRVSDEKSERRYGLKQLWKDIWGEKKD